MVKYLFINILIWLINANITLTKNDIQKIEIKNKKTKMPSKLQLG